VSRKEASLADDTVRRAKCGTSVHAFARRFFGASISGRPARWEDRVKRFCVRGEYFSPRRMSAGGTNATYGPRRSAQMDDAE